MSPRARLLTFSALALVCLLAAFAVPRVPQDPDYHRFADQRTLLGIPNALDVLSNVGFLIVALLGFAGLPRMRVAEHDAKTPIALFFTGLLLTAFGSAWYHLAPNDETLVADRIGMAIAFGALIAMIIGDRIGRAVMPMLAIFATMSVASVLVWYRTDDLRFYGFAQFFPIVAILATHRFARTYEPRDPFLVLLAGYALAKVCELADTAIYDALRFVSGHTLKHLVAAAATLVVWRWLVARQPIASESSPPAVSISSVQTTT